METCQLISGISEFRVTGCVLSRPNLGALFFSFFAGNVNDPKKKKNIIPPSGKVGFKIGWPFLFNQGKLKHTMSRSEVSPP